MPCRREGIVLSRALADVLAVRRGEQVTVEVLEGNRPVRQVVVADLVDDYLGTNAYMSLDALRRLMQEGQTLSGAFLQVDRESERPLYDRLKATPRVARGAAEAGGASRACREPWRT